MRILLTNDDGIYAPGIEALYDALDGLGEILVDTQRARDGTGNLGHFERVGEPAAKVIALVVHEDLGLVLKAPKGGGVEHAVAVTLERCAIGVWSLSVEASK